ncbi:MAG TPA: type II secretion system protein GspC [bacterium]|nr:type II secretion system protein GspC [bacterium]
MGGFFRQYSWVIDLVGILFCSLLLAKITGVYLGKALEVKRSIGVIRGVEAPPAERKRVDLSEYAIIVERNIFDASDRGSQIAAGEEPDEQIQEDAVPTGEAVKTSLSVTVLGVLVVGDGRDKRSTATIAGGGSSPPPTTRGRAPSRGGSQAEVYAVGDEESFAPNTKLVRVAPDRIEFLNGGRLEYAEVSSEFDSSIFGPPVREPVAMKESSTEPSGTIKKEGEGKFAVDRREVDEAIQNLDRLYTEIRAVPNFSGGRVSGMKILSVKGGSIFAKLGLRRGDILQKINGMELDVKRGFEIFNQLKDSTNIQLDLLRQGQPTTLEYEIR